MEPNMKPEKLKNEEDEEPERMRRRVPVRVHDIIIIRGNFRANHTAIQSEVAELLRGATTFQELRHAAAVAEERLRGLDTFESVNVRVDPGPPDLPGTANVVIEVSDPSIPFAKIWGDIWDASGLGMFLPRFEPFRHPFSAAISLYSQDWLNFYSYKQRNLSYSLSVLSSGNYDLSHTFNCYSLPGWPGHSLHSTLQYSFRIYPRDSPLRPTTGFEFRGFEFFSTTQICSTSVEPQILHYRQDVSLRHAIPLGFGGADLRLAVGAAVLFSFSVQGFRARDLAEPRRVLRDIMNNGVWGLPVNATAHLSFDLPLKVLRDAGIRGHVSASTSSTHYLTEIRYRGFALQALKDSLQHDVEVGVIIPTRLFRMEVKCCLTLPPGPFQSISGIVFCFSTVTFDAFFYRNFCSL